MLLLTSFPKESKLIFKEDFTKLTGLLLSAQIIYQQVIPRLTVIFMFLVAFLEYHPDHFVLN